MRVNQGESITLAIAGADVTVSAAVLADLWIKKVMAESAGVVLASPALKPPTLKEGEVYVGAVLSADGTKRHHTILLPGEREGIDHPDALAWAASIGGDLPDRVEQALMFATLRDHFKPKAYWSNTQHAADSDYAWYQSFDDGYQCIGNTVSKLLARAVRREPIE